MSTAGSQPEAGTRIQMCEQPLPLDHVAGRCLTLQSLTIGLAVVAILASDPCPLHAKNQRDSTSPLQRRLEVWTDRSSVTALASGNAVGDVQAAGSSPASQDAPGGAALTKAAIQHFKQPATVRELLLNIKLALEEGWVLRPEFYADDMLLHFFGAQRLEWRIRTDDNLYVRLYGLAYLPSHLGVLPSVGVTKQLRGPDDKLSPHGKIFATIGASCHCQLRIGDIEAIFGTTGRTMTDERERRARMSGPDFPTPPEATDPMGNKNVTYTIASPEAQHSDFSVVFDVNGSIDSLAATEREK